MNKPLYVFFDLDGTLVDSLSAMYQVYLDFLQSFGIIGTEDEFETLNGPSLCELVHILKLTYNLVESHADLLTRYEAMVRDIYQTRVCQMPGASDLLKKLSDLQVKMLVVTASSRTIVEPFLQHQKWRSYFDDVVCGDDVQKAKPHPDIYRLALERSKASPSDVIVVEDSLNGVRSAHAAGLIVYALRGQHSKEDLTKVGASAILASLEDFACG